MPVGLAIKSSWGGVGGIRSALLRARTDCCPIGRTGFQVVVGLFGYWRSGLCQSSRHSVRAQTQVLPTSSIFLFVGSYLSLRHSDQRTASCFFILAWLAVVLCCIVIILVGTDTVTPYDLTRETLLWILEVLAF